MYNPDFWEVQLDQSDLEMMPDDVGLWYESPEDQNSRYKYEDRIGRLIPQIDTLLNGSLTQRQFEAAVLYFKYGKTQREISEIMGISRRGGQPAFVRHYAKWKIHRRCCEKTSQTLPQTRHCHHKLKKRLGVIAQAFLVVEKAIKVHCVSEKLHPFWCLCNRANRLVRFADILAFTAQNAFRKRSRAYRKEVNVGHFNSEVNA